MINYEKLIKEITESSIQIWGDRLEGIYLHGSMAMGCFNPNESDIDLMFVINDDITDTQKMDFMNAVVKLNEYAPKKVLELSVVKKDVCRRFVYPTPFELHFSPLHLDWFRSNPDEYISKMKGVDKDLAAHFTIINHYGVVLYGAPISETFSDVPKENYIDSILYDVENVKEEILDNTMYMVLTLCRVLAVIQDDLVLSKAQGGEWGLSHLPTEYHKLILTALDSYTIGKDCTIDKNNALGFADYMLKCISTVTNG